MTGQTRGVLLQHSRRTILLLLPSTNADRYLLPQRSSTASSPCSRQTQATRRVTPVSRNKVSMDGQTATATITPKPTHKLDYHQRALTYTTRRYQRSPWHRVTRQLTLQNHRLLTKGDENNPGDSWRPIRNGGELSNYLDPHGSKRNGGVWNGGRGF